MGKYAKRQKNIVLHLIHETAMISSLYTVYPEKDFTRNRTINIEELMRILIGMGGSSINKELFNWGRCTNMKRPTASAFVQQRAKLLPDAFGYIFSRYNTYIRNEKTYKGYKLIACDGTCMSYNGYKNDDTFMPNVAGGTNQFHVSALYDLLNRYYISYSIDPGAKANEQMAAWKMLEHTAISGKIIFIGDRGYGGMNLIEHINRIPNASYLIRIKDGLWKEIRSFPMAEFDRKITMQVRTTQKKADKKAYISGDAKWIPGHGKRKILKTSAWDFKTPYKISTRIVRFKLPSGKYETIATSLPQNEFPPSVIKHIYNLRWGIETSFLLLKHSIGITNFHSRKANSIRQEIIARLLLYNLCSRIANSINNPHDGDRKWSYQLNYTMVIYLSQFYFRQKNGPPIDVEEEMLKYLVSVRDGRHDRRKTGLKPPVSFLYRVS